MKSAQPGKSTSGVEVVSVSAQGVWLSLGERERFLPFTDFPWFRDATIAELTNVELPSPHHLYWPDLDIDLAVESIEYPERYPLVSNAKPKKRLRPAKARRQSKPRARSRSRR